MTFIKQNGEMLLNVTALGASVGIGIITRDWPYTAMSTLCLAWCIRYFSLRAWRSA